MENIFYLPSPFKNTSNHFNQQIIQQIQNQSDMQVLTASKRNTIKQKRKNIICKEEKPEFITPIKHLSNNTRSNKNTISPSTQNHIQQAKITLTQKKKEIQLPKNALMKKCFQKHRQIKSIKDLQPLYETKILSKSKYKYKADEVLNTSVHSSEQSSYHKKKKKFEDKVPMNIFAAQTSILYQSNRKPRDHKDSIYRSFSQSKLIKNSIIKYGQKI